MRHLTGHPCLSAILFYFAQVPGGKMVNAKAVGQGKGRLLFLSVTQAELEDDHVLSK